LSEKTRILIKVLAFDFFQFFKFFYEKCADIDFPLFRNKIEMIFQDIKLK